MMNNKKTYTAPTARIVHIAVTQPITTSGGYSNDVYDGDANSRGFNAFDDDEEDYDPLPHKEYTDCDW